MNHPEDKLGQDIARLLELGTDELDAQTRSRLHTARQAALASYKQPAAAPAWAPAWAGGAVSRFTERPVLGIRYLVPIAALIVGLIGIVQWQNSGPWNELAEVDASLLTDELPINAYLDTGFDSWLKRSPR
jgi:hypothetical protein